MSAISVGPHHAQWFNFTILPRSLLILKPGGCFTVWQALYNNLLKICNARNHIYYENFNPKLCMCVQNMALCTRTKFQREVLIKNTISAIHKFWENIPAYSRITWSVALLKISWLFESPSHQQPWYWQCRINDSCLPQKKIETTCTISW